jgi:diazepam-binding inhibitor (GABA receptor modulator, acyl-CoA-binding protein)
MVLLMDFDLAVSKVKNGTKVVTDNNRLKLYSLYKQATEGNCYKDEPWAFQITDHAKWKAWRELLGMKKPEAQSLYIKEVENLGL